MNHIAAAFSQEPVIGWFPGPPALHNHPAVTDMARLSARQQSLHVINPEPSMGGEDFAYYLQHIPGTFAFLVQTETKTGIIQLLLLMKIPLLRPLIFYLKVPRIYYITMVSGEYT